KTIQVRSSLCCLAAAFLFMCQSCPARAFVSTVLTTDYDLDQSTKSKSNRSIVLPPEKSSPVKIPRFDQPPAIDGKLDDEVWKQAVKLKDFYQTTPGDNIAHRKSVVEGPGREPERDWGGRINAEYAVSMPRQ